MMMNLTFYFIQFDLIWIFSQCSNTYKRFDNMLAAVGTLDSYDCIESHRRYQGHLRVAISMNCNSNRVMKLISMNSSQEDTIKKNKRENVQDERTEKSAHRQAFLHIMWKRGNVRPISRDIILLFFVVVLVSLAVDILVDGHGHARPWKYGWGERQRQRARERQRGGELKSTHRSLSSTLCSCWAFLSVFSSSSSGMGRLIRKIHGSQYKNTTRTFFFRTCN